MQVLLALPAPPAALQGRHAAPAAHPASKPSNDSLAAYWTRTLGLFAGLRVRITLADGRTREGFLAPQSHLDVGNGVLVALPLAQITTVEEL
jgi:hypothetical protein